VGRRRCRAGIQAELAFAAGEAAVGVGPPARLHYNVAAGEAVVGSPARQQWVAGEATCKWGGKFKVAEMWPRCGGLSLLASPSLGLPCGSNVRMTCGPCMLFSLT
jgi:hypothetical protein